MKRATEGAPTLPMGVLAIGKVAIIETAGRRR